VSYFEDDTAAELRASLLRRGINPPTRPYHQPAPQYTRNRAHPNGLHPVAQNERRKGRPAIVSRWSVEQIAQWARLNSGGISYAELARESGASVTQLTRLVAKYRDRMRPR